MKFETRRFHIRPLQMSHFWAPTSFSIVKVLEENNIFHWHRGSLWMFFIKWKNNAMKLLQIGSWLAYYQSSTPVLCQFCQSDSLLINHTKSIPCTNQLYHSLTRWQRGQNIHHLVPFKKHWMELKTDLHERWQTSVKGCSHGSPDTLSHLLDS